MALFLGNVPESIHVSTATGLRELGHQLNVSRRFIRFFRFLDTFRAGWLIWTGQVNGGVDIYLDVVSKTCFGLFGMLETMTLLELIPVDNLRIFSHETYKEIDHQAQLLWFAGLYTSVLVSGFRLFRLFTSQPVRIASETISASTGDNPAEIAEADKELPEKSGAYEKTPEADLGEERERLKGIVAKRKEERRTWLQDVSAQATLLGRGALSDALDMVLPGTSLGWVQVQPGLVSSAMFLTTLTTGMAVWERVGRDLQAKKQRV